MVNWNGCGKKVAVKTNYPRKGVKDITIHEAATLAYLDGRAGAPRLICTDPDKGIIVMEYLGKKTLGDIIRKGKYANKFWLQILYSCT